MHCIANAARASIEHRGVDPIISALGHDQQRVSAPQIGGELGQLIGEDQEGCKRQRNHQHIQHQHGDGEAALALGLGKDDEQDQGDEPHARNAAQDQRAQPVPHGNLLILAFVFGACHRSCAPLPSAGEAPSPDSLPSIIHIRTASVKRRGAL